MLQNTVAMIEQTVTAFPKRPFIIHDRGRLSYEEFYEATLALAGWLQRQGIVKGDRVA